MELALLLLRNLLLTVAIEGAAVALIFRRREAILYSAVVNVMTNPILNVLVIGLCGLLSLPYAPVTATLELAAAAAEAWAYHALLPLPWPKSAGLSLLLNALSFGTGLLIA